MRWFFLWPLLLGVLAADITVDSDFPGGSARILELDSAKAFIRLVPQPYKDRGWACWWYFRADGLDTNETLTIQVGGTTFAKPQQAVYSTDQQSWQQTKRAEKNRSDYVYTLRPSATTLWFAWGPPFVLADAQVLTKTAAKASPDIHAYTLCKSAEGHDVPALKLGQGPKAIWIQARQHAWESGASWVAKGLVDWLGSDAAEPLRAAATLHLIPIMDVDNVERGAGGKNQSPQDHNRDWSDHPHWPEVRHAQQAIEQLAKQQEFTLFIDLHNPAPGDQEPFFYLPPSDILSEAQRDNQQRFLAAARQHMDAGPLKFKGRTRVSGKNYDRKNWRRISKNWVADKMTGQTVSVTLETAWNTPESTAQAYQALGQTLGETIGAFIVPAAE